MRTIPLDNETGSMRNGLRIASILVLLAGVGLLAWLVFHSFEPSYHGKSLSVWLDQAQQNKEIGNMWPGIYVDTPTARAVRAMGKDALPALLRMARTRDTAMRRRLIALSDEYAWIGVHPEPFDHIQMKAAYGFFVLGPAAKPALSKLISMLDDSAPEVRALAAFAIGKIGPESARAIPALQKLITRPLAPNPQGTSAFQDRYVAAYALGAMGPAARAALPQIELLRQDSNMIVRAVAEAAFIRISGAGLSAIVEPLKAPSDSTNWLFAAEAVQFLGTNGAPAIPFLLQALQSTNARVSSLALNALAAIHMSPEITIPAILPLIGINNTNAWDRANALDVLRSFGPSARGLAPVAILLQALTDPDLNVRAHATNALRHIDPEAAKKAGIDAGED
jgi:HEAT repeat protein